MKLLIGTANPGKIAEFKRLLLDLPLHLVTPQDLKIREQPREESMNMEVNARAKAKFYGEKSGCATIADDGGFEIDALGGMPGGLSRRWLAYEEALAKGISRDRIPLADLAEATDEQLIAYTVQKMHRVPPAKRSARIRTVLVLRLPDGREIVNADAMTGMIAESAPQQRTHGFPFRDILWIPERGKLYSEFTEAERRAHNHRARALEPIRAFLLDHIRRTEGVRERDIPVYGG